MPPDPVDAIRFRMDQLGLRQADLVPLLGARSRVSEVLARKRPLTLDMMRALNKALGIPWESLVAAQQPAAEDDFWNALPAAAMRARGWIEYGARAKVSEVRSALEAFFDRAGGRKTAMAHFRKSHSRIGMLGHRAPLVAWATRVTELARRIEDEGDVPQYTLKEDDLRSLVAVSPAAEGPTMAMNWLRSVGVLLLVLPALPGTLVDGVAIRLESGRGAIGLSCRYDRLDNFWFTLLHECAHLVRHLGGPFDPQASQIIDDLDVSSVNDPRESEADALASELLLPERLWEASAVKEIPAAPTVAQLAEEAAVHPAIVAGRVRRQRNDYRILSGMVGQGQVKQQLLAAQPGYIK